jgi:hypothetical protein
MIGQMIYGGLPMVGPKMALMGILILGFITIMVFSWIPMSKNYPAYAADPTTAPAWWTGFSLGVVIWFISMAWKM